MTSFIKLTEVFGNDKTLIVTLNADHIVVFKLGDKGKDTHITLSNGKYFFVRESVEEIFRLINTDNTLAPIIMTAEEALKYYKMRDGG